MNSIVCVCHDSEHYLTGGSGSAERRADGDCCVWNLRSLSAIFSKLSVHSVLGGIDDDGNAAATSISDLLSLKCEPDYLIMTSPLYIL